MGVTDGWVFKRKSEQQAVNPFSPTFGTAPPYLAGRSDTLERISEAVETGPHHPDYTILIMGPRGSGKTALLNALEQEAEQASWVTISASASTPDLCASLTQSALTHLSQVAKRKRKITSVGAAGLTATWDTAEPSGVPNLRAVLTSLVSILDTKRRGVLVTVDEFQAAEAIEARELAATVQHVTRRERHPLLFVGAALTGIDDSLLSDPGMTFFQRCARAHLHPLSDQDASEALRRPIHDHGSSIAEADLRTAVAAASGYPYMVQLIGYHSWEASDSPMSGLTGVDVEQGITRAEAALVDQVVKPVWVSLSDQDKRFLMAMAQDEDVSRISDIADRIQRSNDFARSYRGRLVRADVIVPAGRGLVRFRHRTLHDWLRSDDPPPIPGDTTSIQPA